MWEMIVSQRGIGVLVAKVGDVELPMGFPEVDQDIEWTQRARGVHVRFNRKD